MDSSKGHETGKVAIVNIYELSEESNVTITLDNTQEENKIKNILNKEGDENRSGFRKCEF